MFRNKKWRNYLVYKNALYEKLQEHAVKRRYAYLTKGHHVSTDVQWDLVIKTRLQNRWKVEKFQCDGRKLNIEAWIV